jgi:hypothetical protein
METVPDLQHPLVMSDIRDIAKDMEQHPPAPERFDKRHIWR